jgi:hypothetical protein
MIDSVIIPEYVYDQMAREFLCHLDGPKADHETGWIFLGNRLNATIAQVYAAVSSQGKEDSGPAHFQFDVEQMANLICQEHRSSVLGLAHSHPPGPSQTHPSAMDYEGDIEWIKYLDHEEGIFGIVWDQRKSYRIGAFRTPSVVGITPFAINLFALATGDPQYRRVNIIREAKPCQNAMKQSETSSSSSRA